MIMTESRILIRVKFGKSADNARYELFKILTRFGNVEYHVTDNTKVGADGRAETIRQKPTEKQATRGLCRTWHSEMLG